MAMVVSNLYIVQMKPTPTNLTYILLCVGTSSFDYKTKLLFSSLLYFVTARKRDHKKVHVHYLIS